MPDIRGARLHSAQQFRFEPADHIGPTVWGAASAVKIVVLGAVGVGKTAVVRRFASDRFSPDYVTTLGAHIVARDLTITRDTQDGAARRLRFVVWDTDGDLGQSIFGTPYVAGAAAAIGVADATRPNTVDAMWSLLKTFESRCPRRPTCAIVTKCDIASAHPPGAESERFPRLLQVSAATGQGVHEAFLGLAAEIQTRGDVT